jgi:hypothetical protein
MVSVMGKRWNKPDYLVELLDAEDAPELIKFWRSARRRHIQAQRGVVSGRRSAAAPKSRADLACGGSHENAWVIVPAEAAASIIS